MAAHSFNTKVTDITNIAKVNNITSSTMTTPASPTKTQPTKLRDSCNACAVSKLKCSKEKPECARCAKRGLRCEYFATRRAGRKHEPRPRQHDNGSSITKSGVSDDISDTQSSVHVAVSAISVATSHLTPPWDMDVDVHMSDDITEGPLSDALSSGASTLAGNDATSWRMLSTAVMPDAHDIFASFQMPSQLFDAGVSEEGGKTISSPDNDDFDFGDFTGFLAPDTAALVLDDAAFDAVDQFRLSSAWNSPSSPSLSSLSSHPSTGSPSMTTTSVLTTTTQRTSISHSSPGSCGLVAPPPTTTPTPRPTTTAPAASGCCLVRALDILKPLFPGSATCTCHGAISGPESHYRNSSDFPTTEHVVTRNKETLEAIRAMLECPCSSPDNGYLLAVISLAVLKVLGWYKAAVQDLPFSSPASTYPTSPWKAQQHAQQPEDGSRFRRAKDPTTARGGRRACHTEHVLQTPAVIDGYRLEGDDQGRMAAQLVLSELHRVQRLVNVLGSRLQQQHQHQDEGNSSSSGVGGLEGAFFSPVWFGQLEGDLRGRVRGLSLEIVDMLSR